MFTPHRSGLALVGMLIVVAILAGVSSDRSPEQPSPIPPGVALIEEAGPVLEPEPETPWILRSRPITLDPEVLIDAARRDVAGEPAQPITIDLFDGAATTFTATRISVFELDGDLAPGARVTWVGVPSDGSAGHVTLSLYGDAIHGVIHVADSGVFEIRSVADGTHRLDEVISDAFAPCGTGAEHAIDFGPEVDAGGFEGGGGIAGTPVVDVLVVYTPSARQVMGGTSGMLALIDSTMSQTQSTYGNSEINLIANLAGTHETVYSESGNPSTDLSRVRDVGDGYMDEVHEIRANTQADLVALLVTYGSGNSCGVGYCMGSPSQDFSPNAFSVTRIQCISNLTFPHELGHNMGCHHDHDNGSGSCGTYSYSYGHRFFGNANQYRTVMAYQPGTRIPYFSNPDVMFDGGVTGVPIGEPEQAHNALTLTLNGPIAETFSDVLTPTECDEFNNSYSVPGDFATIQEALVAAETCDEIVVGPGVYTGTVNLVGKIVTLRSAAGPEATILDAGDDGSVLRIGGLVNSALVIDGFTITGGTGSNAQIGGQTYEVGGGIYAISAGATIKNCIIAENDAQFGGGVFSNSASIDFENCLFIGNTASASGAGAFNFQANAITYTGCTFEGNIAASGGGGMSSQNSQPMVADCHFIGNTAGTDGGGMRNISGTAAVVAGCTFADNVASGSGGGVYNQASSGTSIGTSEFCSNDPSDIAGSYDDAGGNEFAGDCLVVTPGDLDENGIVDGADLAILLGAWGPCSDCDACPADLDGDCAVDGADLAVLLGNWS